MCEDSKDPEGTVQMHQTIWVSNFFLAYVKDIFSLDAEHLLHAKRQ